MDYRSAEPLVALIIILLTIDISFVGPQQAVSSLKNMDNQQRNEKKRNAASAWMHSQIQWHCRAVINFAPSA